MLINFFPIPACLQQPRKSRHQLKAALRSSTKPRFFGELLPRASSSDLRPAAGCAKLKRLYGCRLLRIVDEKKAELEGKRASLNTKAVRLEAALRQKKGEQLALEARAMQLTVQVGQARSARDSLRSEEAVLLKITSTVQVSKHSTGQAQLAAVTTDSHNGPHTNVLRSMYS